MTDHDIVVIGGGMAGSTAALFAARLGRSTLLLNDGLPGGQLLNVGRIEDYPGFAEPVGGFELCPSVQDQAHQAGAEFETSQAKELIRTDHGWKVLTTGDTIQARSIIVATGSHPLTLGLDGEEELMGRGISHCASCDGPLYRDRAVAAVGGGDSALQEALELSEHVKRVVLVHRGSSFSGQAAYASRVLSSDAIEILFDTEVTELIGDGSLVGVNTKNTRTGEEGRVDVEGLFVYIGVEPNADIVPVEVDRDHHGRIHADIRMRTSLEGLLAAGDVRAESAGQAVTAAGDGATAAVTAHRYLAGEPWTAALTSHGAP